LQPNGLARTFCAVIAGALALAASTMVTMAVDVVPLDIPADIASIRTQPALGFTIQPVGPGEQPLTAQLLENYVARQQQLREFSAFDPAAPGEITEDILLGYIARGSLGSANGALAAIETFTANQPNPSLTASTLADYVRNGYVPTVERISTASTEQNCLAQAIYHEARGESADGQLAVANVIVNRARSSRYPDTLCGVIYQNADRGRYRCQFTFACDGRDDTPRERAAWARSKALAERVYANFVQGQNPGALPASVLYYHTTAVRPSWSGVFQRVAQIGTHVFYSPN
jgi:hypothetical protein